MTKLIAEYIGYNLATGVKPESLATLTGLGRTQFAGAFKTAFGVSLHSYVLTRKMEAAKAQLRGSKKVTEIALDLGFASHAHFTTTFRKLTGTTPSEYRDTCAAATES